MKVNIDEFEDVFSIHLEAEDVSDAAKILRLGLLRTKELKWCGVSATISDTIQGGIEIGKDTRRSEIIEGKTA